MIWLILAVIIILGLVIYIISLYNRLITLRNVIEGGFAQIRVLLKQRMDMIGQLVESTKGYMEYEKEIMEKVTDLRTRVGRIVLENAEEIRNLDREMRDIFSRLIAVVENYPDLKANENVKKLMDSIREMEDKIAKMRMLYNENVVTYNITIQRFPNNLFAGILGFRKLPLLQFGEEVEERPRIEL